MTKSNRQENFFLFFPNVEKLEKMKVKVPDFYKGLFQKFKFVEKSEEEMEIKDEYRGIWENLLKDWANNKKCSCGNDIVELNGFCTICALKNDNPKWKYSYFDLGKRFLCYNIELYNKAKNFVFEGKEGSEILVDKHLEVWFLFRWYFWAKQNKICPECKEETLLYRGQLHHKFPKVLGGLEEEDNLVFLCNKCHGKKRDEVHKFKTGKLK